MVIITRAPLNSNLKYSGNMSNSKDQNSESLTDDGFSILKINQQLH